MIVAQMAKEFLDIFTFVKKPEMAPIQQEDLWWVDLEHTSFPAATVSDYNSLIVKIYF